MKSVQLGRQGLVVSRIGLRCAGTNDEHDASDDEESIATVHGALDAGVTLLDATDVGKSTRDESRIRQVLAQRRGAVVLATAVGLPYGIDGKALQLGGRACCVRTACEALLKRFKIDEIDLCYQPGMDKRMPIEETIGAMQKLVEQGKIRFVGLSQTNASMIQRAHRVHPLSAVQADYSLWSREPETHILPTLRRLKIGLVAHSPLGRGFLSGAFKTPDDFSNDDYRRSHPSFSGRSFYEKLKIQQRLEDMAARRAVTTAQLALAFVLSQGEDTVPIPATKKRRRLVENIEALKVKLSFPQLRELRDLLPIGVNDGPCYIKTSRLTH